MTNRATMKNKLINYFKEGSKTDPSGIGVEVEHYLIDEKTLRSYRYDEQNGQRDFLNNLIKKGWKVINEENNQPLGIEKDQSTITLEPGGQVEISLKTLKSIKSIETKYLKILEEMKSVLVEGQVFVSTGYHPSTSIDELPLLPKERYHSMYEYFKNRGEKSHFMMKGTAATQVSIDYKDEADFIKKYRVAVFLGPIISRLFDASPVFEGELVEGENLRIDIWNHTDPVRTKYPVGAFENVFDFEAYADYILKLPPIFTKINDAYLFTKDRVLEDIVEEYPVEHIDVDHLLGMAFPDVRLKKYIEIRMADSLPMPYVFALPALIKGIFYNPSILDRYYEFAMKYTLEDAIAINEQLLHELDFTYKDISMNWFMMKVMLDAKSGLSPEEAGYIDLLFEQLNSEGSFKKKLEGLYKEDKNKFLEAIKG